jgi:Ser-tRNA(Ala) deacylase AlaX
MTGKMFWKDPYLTELDTLVTSVKDTNVTVEQTIFFPFSGGQESDDALRRDSLKENGRNWADRVKAQKSRQRQRKN